MNKPQKFLTLLNRSLIPTFTKVQGQEILTVTESRTYWINDKELTRDLHRSPNGTPLRQGVIRNLRSLAGLDPTDETWKVSGSDTAPVVTMAKSQRVKPERFRKLDVEADSTVWDAFCCMSDGVLVAVINHDTNELYTANYGELRDEEAKHLDDLYVIDAYSTDCSFILRV